MKKSRAIAYIAAVAAVLAIMYTFIIVYGLSPKLGLDLEGGVSVTLQALGDADREQIEKAADIVRNRVDALGLAEPVVAAQGDNRILVQIPGVQDTERVLSIIGSTAQLQFREVLEVLAPGDENYDITEITVPDPNDLEAYEALRDQEIVLSKESPDGEILKVRLGPTRLTGDIIESAEAAVDQFPAGESAYENEEAGTGHVEIRYHAVHHLKAETGVYEEIRGAAPGNQLAFPDRALQGSYDRGAHRNDTAPLSASSVYAVTGLLSQFHFLAVDAVVFHFLLLYGAEGIQPYIKMQENQPDTFVLQRIEY